MAKPGPMMPVVSHPKTKPGGTPYTENDPEFHELERNGGIRSYTHIPYPAMRYRGAIVDGKAGLVHKLVESEREDDEARKDGWIADQVKALADYERAQEQIAQAAAETAYVAEKQMSPQARAEYRKRSAATADHVTE